MVVAHGTTSKDCGLANAFIAPSKALCSLLLSTTLIIRMPVIMKLNRKACNLWELEWQF
jgi:hypothetical protein